jgi:hypothetical protein
MEIEMNDRINSALKCAGYFGARLRAGKIGVQIGDAILIDPARGLFAVGDSSDRDPRAARLFMHKLSDILNDISILSTNGIVQDHQLDALMREIVDRSREMLQKSPSKGTTTFTGILLLRTEHSTKAMLFHTGDSVLLAFHPQKGIRKITENNFWLIGKVQEFYQVNIFDVIPGDRFLFATDGLQDLTPPEGKEFDAYIAELFREHPVEDIPDILIGNCDTKTVGKDDLALLALAPDRPFPSFSGIILGREQEYMSEST